MWKRILSAIVTAVIAAMNPVATANMGAMAIVKHKTPINNATIPIINLLLSFAAMFGKEMMGGADVVSSLGPALTEATGLMAASTAMHQSLKLATERSV